MEIEIPPFPALVEYRSQLYYAPPCSLATVQPSNNLMEGLAMYFPRATPLDRIGIETTIDGEAGSKVRLGAYASIPGQTFPGALLFDAGQVAGDGGAGAKELVIAQTVGPGWVWLAAVCQSAPTTRPTLRGPGSTSYPGNVGRSAGGTFAAANGYTQAGVSGALPATFTTTPGVASVMLPYVRIA